MIGESRSNLIQLLQPGSPKISTDLLSLLQKHTELNSSSSRIARQPTPSMNQISANILSTSSAFINTYGSQLLLAHKYPSSSQQHHPNSLQSKAVPDLKIISPLEKNSLSLINLNSSKSGLVAPLYTIDVPHYSPITLGKTWNIHRNEGSSQLSPNLPRQIESKTSPENIKQNFISNKSVLTTDRSRHATTTGVTELLERVKMRKNHSVGSVRTNGQSDHLASSDIQKNSYQFSKNKQEQNQSQITSPSSIKSNNTKSIQPQKQLEDVLNYSQIGTLKGQEIRKYEFQSQQLGVIVRSKKEMVDCYSEATSMLVQKLQTSIVSINKKERDVLHYLNEQNKIVESSLNNCIECLSNMIKQSNEFFSSLKNSVQEEYLQARLICESSLASLDTSQGDLRLHYQTMINDFDHEKVSKIIGACSLRSSEISQFLDSLNKKELKDLLFRFDSSETESISFKQFSAQMNALLNKSLKKLKTAFVKQNNNNNNPNSQFASTEMKESLISSTPPSTAVVTTDDSAGKQILFDSSPVHRRIHSNPSNLKTPIALLSKEESFSGLSITQPSTASAKDNSNLKIHHSNANSSFFHTLDSSFVSGFIESSKNENKVADPINLSKLQVNSIDLSRLRILNNKSEPKESIEIINIPQKSIYVSFDNKEAFQKGEGSLCTFRNLRGITLGELQVEPQEKQKGFAVVEEEQFEREDRGKESVRLESAVVRNYFEQFESKKNTPNFSNKKQSSHEVEENQTYCRPYECDLNEVERSLQKLIVSDQQNTLNERMPADSVVEEMVQSENRSRENSLTRLENYNRMLKAVQQNQFNRSQNCEQILRKVSETSSSGSSSTVATVLSMRESRKSVGIEGQFTSSCQEQEYMKGKTIPQYHKQINRKQSDERNDNTENPRMFSSRYNNVTEESREFLY